MTMKGSELQRLRKLLRLTQKGLAEKIGVAPNTVARWERDERQISTPVERFLLLLKKELGGKKARKS